MAGDKGSLEKVHSQTSMEKDSATHVSVPELEDGGIQSVEMKRIMFVFEYLAFQSR
jgi:hypothetical protein